MLRVFKGGKCLVMIFCTALVAVLLLSRCATDSRAKITQALPAPRTIRHSKSLLDHNQNILAEKIRDKLDRKLQEDLIDSVIDVHVASRGSGLYFVEKSDGKYIFINVGKQTMGKFRYSKRR